MQNLIRMALNYKSLIMLLITFAQKKLVDRQKFY